MKVDANRIDQFSKKFLHFLVNFIIFIIGILFVLIIRPFISLFQWVNNTTNKVSIDEQSKQRRDQSKTEYSSYFMRELTRKYTGNNEQAQNNRVFIYFLVPSFTAFTIFVIVPFFMGIYYSMTDWNGINTGRQSFIGFQNYIGIFNDAQFVYSFLRTVLYSVLNIVVINLVAFGLALLVTQNLKLKNVYRAGFFMPNLIGGLVLGYIWQFMYNKAFTALGGVFTHSIIASGDYSHGMLALIIVVTWQYAGYIMMIYIAAIQNVPQDLVEASTIDGANAFQRLRHVVFPLVMQAFTVALFLTLVTSFKQFDTIVSLTNGDPVGVMPSWLSDLFGLGVTPVKELNLIARNIYNSAFVDYEMGVGQAKAIVFFIVLLFFSILQVNYTKKKEVEL
ncbi:MAG: carbohydrate ABC transporter permease [Candidatus Izemoplasmatales bacterium]